MTPRDPSPPPDRFRPHPLDAAIVGGAALLVRLAYFAEYRRSPFYDFLHLDPLYYHDWAVRIASGDWIGTEVFEQSPLYPYLLAVYLLIFGEGLTPLRLIQFAVGSATAVLTSVLAARLFGRAAGLCAGLLAAIYGPCLFFEGQVMKEFLTPFFSVATLLLFDLAVTRRKGRRWLLAGAGTCIGLAALVRDNVLLVLPALAIALLLSRRASRATKESEGDESRTRVERGGKGGYGDDRGMSPGAGGARGVEDTRRKWRGSRAAEAGGARGAIGDVLALAAGTFAVLLPVAVRNYAVSGDLVLTTSGGGEVFYIGNGPYANGAYIVPPWVRSSPKYEHEDFRKKARELTGRDLTRAEASRFWWREGLKAILADPIRWIRLEARKALLFLNNHELPDNYSYGSFLRFSRVLPWLPTFGPVLALACAGLAAAARPPRRRAAPRDAGAPARGDGTQGSGARKTGGGSHHEAGTGTSPIDPGAAGLRDLLPLLLAGAVYMASVMLFFNFGRFRLPVLPILFVLAGSGAVAIAGAVVPRHAFFDVGRTHLARTRARDGSRTPSVRSRLARAAILAALAAGVFAVSRIDLHSEAEEPFQDRLHLAAAWRKAGRPGEAEEILRLTIREAEEILVRRGWKRGDPAVPGGVTFALSLHTAHRDLAGVLLERGRRREAIEELRSALPLDPNDAAVYRLLGGALLAEGDLEEAESVLRQGLLVEPGSFTLRFDHATALYESGRSLEALEELREAAARNPALGDLDRADWHYGMGVVLLALPGGKEQAEALEHLEAALALNPSHPHAAEARAEIDRLRR